MKLNRNIVTGPLQLVVDHLIKESKVNENLAESIKATERDQNLMWQYIKGQAKKQAVNGCACIADEDVFKWAEDFYLMTDEEYKALEPEKPKKAKNENKPEKKEPVNVEVKEEPPVVLTQESSKPKAKKEEALEGQMDMFSFLGA